MKEFILNMNILDMFTFSRLPYYIVSIVVIPFICHQLDIWKFLFRKWPCFFLGYLVDLFIVLVFLYQLNSLDEEEAQNKLD